MTPEEAIAAIETCNDVDCLSRTLQRIIEAYGFASFNFLDAGHPEVDEPLFFGTSGHAWEEEYRSNKFVHVDPCVARARRTNVPFNWGTIKMPKRTGRRKPGSLKTFEAARDHGFMEGLVIPYHFTDSIGRMHSSSSVLFWKDTISKFKFMLSGHKYDLHLIMIYFVQRAIDIHAERHRGGARFLDSDGQPLVGVTLTDRERDVLSWAGRGKTVGETADILVISEDTVETHVRNAMRKLGADNKTHAVVKAIYLGLIDV